MRALLQRVSQAQVSTAQGLSGSIEQGLLVFLGIENADGPEDLEWLERKILQIRLFEDAQGVMNRSLEDLQGGLLLVSQFTLQANAKKGNRPSYNRAAPPDIAQPLFDQLAERLRARIGDRLQTGVFGAMMEVQLCNDGPVTIWLDSKQRGY